MQARKALDLGARVALDSALYAQQPALLHSAATICKRRFWQACRKVETQNCWVEKQDCWVALCDQPSREVVAAMGRTTKESTKEKAHLIADTMKR